MQAQQLTARPKSHFRILLLPLALCLGLLQTFAGPAESRNAHPVNFVIFIADDLGEGDLGCYGNPFVRTPHIDQLAREGMRFTKAFLTISSCSPSRASILTGRYPHNTQAEDLHQPLPASQKTVAHHLGQKGYYRASVGKWHLGPEEKNNWNRVVECEGEEMAERTAEMISQRPKDKPFFFWIASIDPHRPYQTNAIAEPHPPSEVRIPPYLPDHPLIRADLALYYDEIARFDEQIGRIREQLAAAGVLDNTLIVFLSDNGMPFPRAKTTLYDSGIHTPLLARWPGVVQPGSVQNSLVSSLDLASTLLQIAGIEAPAMEGISLLPLLRQTQASVRSLIFAEANWHDFEQFTRAVRDDRYKLIRNYYWDTPLWNSVDSINSQSWTGFMKMAESGQLTPAQSFLLQPQRPFEEFYDLEQDPFELRNVIDDPSYRDQANRLKTALDNWRVETRDLMPGQRTPDGWTRDGIPLPHNQPWYDRYLKQGGRSSFEKF